VKAEQVELLTQKLEQFHKRLDALEKKKLK
jgi:hypothetical protein